MGVKLRSTCVREDRARAPVCCTRREFSYDVSSEYCWNVTHSHHSQLNWLCFNWSHTENKQDVFRIDFNRITTSVQTIMNTHPVEH